MLCRRIDGGYLEAAERYRLSLGPRKPECYVQMTARVSALLRERFGVNTQDASESLLTEDLNSVCGIRLLRPSTERGFEDLEPQYLLFDVLSRVIMRK